MAMVVQPPSPAAQRFNPFGYLLCLTEPRYLSGTSAWQDHIPFAFACIEMLRPRVLAELGTHKGDSYCAFCQAVDMLRLATKCYAIDTWKGDEHAGFYDDRIFRELKAYHDPLYGSFSRLIRSTFDEALDHFPDGSVDLLHIDGLHTYEAVSHDFETWLPKMSARGVMLLHDTNVREHGFGVGKLWTELSQKYPTFEFGHGHGLGVLAVGSEGSGAMLSLTSADQATTQLVRSVFFDLGKRAAAGREAAHLRQELQTLTSEASERADEIRRVRTELNAHAREAAERALEIDRLRTELRAKHNQVLTWQNKAQEIRRSLVWKIVKPAWKLERWCKTRTRSPADSSLAPQPSGELAPRPRAPEWEELAAAAAAHTARQADRAPLVDVIVPVYRGLDDTLACLHSVLRAENDAPFEIVVIDDRSPEPELSVSLRRLAESGAITLLINEQNRGFVGSANRGMGLHPDRDVVLLNSDTLVYGNWLDRLRARASVERVGTVTPLSTNATICSYPAICQNNNVALELDYPELDALCAAINPGASVDVPTAVGFCMYIRRQLLNAIGSFDEEVFGKGYGEENDFCMRARTAGWRHVLGLDTFVRHTGEVSFSREAKARQDAGMRALRLKHPHYMDLVREHIAADPAAPARRRLDTERLARLVGAHPLLHVTHTWGGGVKRYVRDLRGDDGAREVLTLVPHARDSMEGDLGVAGWKLLVPNLQGLHLVRDRDILVDVLRTLGVESVLVHSFAGWHRDAVGAVPDLAAALGVPYDFMVHDYMAACPRINLIDSSGRYCGREGLDPAVCQICVDRNGSPFGKVDVIAWRKSYARFLAGARSVAAPSVDAARRFQRCFPDTEVRTRPPRERMPPVATSLAAPYTGGPVRIAVIGAIGRHKGSDLLLACARDAQERALPLRFVIVGYTDNRELRAMSNVEVTGRYEEDEVLELLREQACHAFFLPSVWPETYCYTLSIAFHAGLPSLCFDIGAQAQRIRECGGVVLPTKLWTDPAQINDHLLAFVRGSSPREAIQDPGLRHEFDSRISRPKKTSRRQ